MLRLLIVDDEPDLCMAMSMLFADDYEVVTASNGLEALERLDRYDPDVVIMDLNLPMFDGMDTARAIRKNTAFAEVPIIFLSGDARPEALSLGSMSELDLFLLKPVDPEGLKREVRSLAKRGNLEPRAKAFTMTELQRLYPAGVTSTSPPTMSPERPKAGTPPAPSPIPPKPDRLRVLAVDDDPDILDYMRVCLQDDYEIITTIDGEAAPDKIIAYQPDILLLDIIMPKLNGFHLAYLIRLNKRLRGAKVIYVSSRSDRESIEKAFRLGASEYIEKPFTPDQLRRRLAEVTRKPDFHLMKKRIPYAEVQRREGLM